MQGCIQFVAPTCKGVPTMILVEMDGSFYRYQGFHGFLHTCDLRDFLNQSCGSMIHIRLYFLIADA